MSTRRPFIPRRGRGFFPRRGNFVPRGRKNFNPDFRLYQHKKHYDDDYKYHARRRYSRSRSRSPSYRRHRRSRSRSRSYSRSYSRSRSRSPTPRRYRSASPRKQDHSPTPRKYDSPKPRKESLQETSLSLAAGDPASSKNPSLTLYDADVPVKSDAFKSKFIPIGEASKNKQTEEQKSFKREYELSNKEAATKPKDMPIYSDDDDQDTDDDGHDMEKGKKRKAFLHSLDENKDIRTILLERAMLEKKKLGLDNPGTSEKSSALEALQCYSPEPQSPHQEKIPAKKSILKNRNVSHSISEKKEQPARAIEDAWSLLGTKKSQSSSLSREGDDWAGLLALEKKHIAKNWHQSSKRDPENDWNLREEKVVREHSWPENQTEKKAFIDSWNLKSERKQPQASHQKDPSPSLPTIPGLGFSSVDDEDAFLYGDEADIDDKKQVEEKSTLQKNRSSFGNQSGGRDYHSKTQPMKKDRSGWSDEEDLEVSLPQRGRKLSRTPSPLQYAEERQPSKRHSSWERNESDTIDLQLSMGNSKAFTDDLFRLNKASPSQKLTAFSTKSSNDWESESPPPAKSHSQRRRSPDLTDDLMKVNSPLDRYDEGQRMGSAHLREKYQRASLEKEDVFHSRSTWSESPVSKRRQDSPERGTPIYREKRMHSPLFYEKKRYRQQSPFEEASYRSKRENWSPLSNSLYGSSPPPTEERMERSPSFQDRHGRYSPGPPSPRDFRSPSRSRNKYWGTEPSSPSPSHSRHRHRERYRSPPRSERRRRYSSPSPPRSGEMQQCQDTNRGHQFSVPIQMQHQQQQQPQQPYFHTNPQIIYQDPNFLQQFPPPPTQNFFPPGQFPIPNFPPQPSTVDFSVPPPNYQAPSQMSPGIFSQLSRTNLKIIPILNTPYSDAVQQSAMPPMSAPMQIPLIQQHMTPVVTQPELQKPPKKLSDVERNHLVFLCEEKQQRLISLNSELEQLQKVQGEMMRKKQRQKDGHKDPLILANAKQQEDLSRQIAETNATIVDCEQKLGFKVTFKKPEEPIEKKVKNEEEKEESVETALSKFEYFDPGSHWCESCNDIFSNLFVYLDHLLDTKHKEKMNLLERPWNIDQHSKKSNLVKSGHPVLAPLKGVQFIMPTNGFYCKVCKTFMGDISGAEEHVKSGEHNRNFTKHVLLNPQYEKKWHYAKTQAMARLRKENRRKQKEEDDKRIARMKALDAEARRKNKELIRAERKLNESTEELEEGGSTNNSSGSSSKAAANIKLTLLGKQQKKPTEKKAVSVVYIGKAPNFRPKEDPKKAGFGKFSWSKNNEEKGGPKKAEEVTASSSMALFPLRKSKAEATYQKPIGPEPPPVTTQCETVQPLSYPEADPSVPSDRDIAKAFAGNMTSWIPRPLEVSSQKQTEDTVETIPMDIDDPSETEQSFPIVHQIPKLTVEEEQDLALLGISKDDFALLAKPRPPMLIQNQPQMVVPVSPMENQDVLKKYSLSESGTVDKESEHSLLCSAKSHDVLSDKVLKTSVSSFNSNNTLVDEYYIPKQEGTEDQNNLSIEKQTMKTVLEEEPLAETQNAKEHESPVIEERSAKADIILEEPLAEDDSTSEYPGMEQLMAILTDEDQQNTSEFQKSDSDKEMKNMEQTDNVLQDHNTPELANLAIEKQTEKEQFEDDNNENAFQNANSDEENSNNDTVLQEPLVDDEKNNDNPDKTQVAKRDRVFEEPQIENQSSSELESPDVEQQSSTSDGVLDEPFAEDESTSEFESADTEEQMAKTDTEKPLTETENINELDNPAVEEETDDVFEHKNSCGLGNSNLEEKLTKAIIEENRATIADVPKHEKRLEVSGEDEAATDDEMQKVAEKTEDLEEENVSPAHISVSAILEPEDGHALSEMGYSSDEDEHGETREGSGSLPLDFVVLDELTQKEVSEGFDQGSDACNDEVLMESDDDDDDDDSVGSDGTIIMGDVELLDEAKCSGDSDDDEEEED